MMKGMIQVIKQLFVNSVILIAALFVCGQQFTYKPLKHTASLKLRIISGIMSGFVGCILIIYGVMVTDKIVVDFRYISLIVSSIYGGPLAAFVGGIIIALFRVFYSGFSYASIVAGIFILSQSLGCSIVSMIKVSDKKKWVLMLVYTEINSFFALHFVIPDFRVLISTFIPYSIGLIILTLTAHYYAEAISLSNELIRNLKKESSNDFLTGLNNVRNFDKLYNEALKNAQEKNENLSVVTVDIDYFKKVNDTYGHQAGDEILKKLGEILIENSRRFDIVSRNGGEEFSIILINCSAKTAFEIAERIRKRVEETKFTLPDNRQINITVSAGIASFPDTAKDNESLYKNADNALYKAKNTGRNKVCYYSSNSIMYCDLADVRE
jgi:diguanylate cyclase